MVVNATIWIGFIIFVLLMLALDLFVFNRKPHEIKIKEALLWSGFWIALALLFNYGVFIWFGKEKAIEFLTAYIVEESLSIDNLFVFILILRFFDIKPQHQHRILFWGIIGAIILRAIFIIAGIALIGMFHWIIYIFGVFLIFTGAKIPFEKDKKLEPDKNIMVRLFKKFMPVSNNTEKGKLFIRANYKTYATPLFIALIMIEFSDLIFAVDSIPAVLAISNDPFIVYTSNVFAILGLRSLYFALAVMVGYFRYLKFGLSAILIFVGTKMCISGYYKIPTVPSLLVIISLILIAVLASLVIKEENSNENSLG
ncbi:MAG: TerC family protein [Bacteroidales bacterium]|nr:TerC family protein [Bacteroidales bacterium]